MEMPGSKRKEISKKIKEEYNKISSTWREKVWVVDNDFTERIHSFLPALSKQKILDVGIGAGDLASIFEEGNEIYGVDISQGMINLCRDLHPNYKLICTDATNLPFKDGSFDVVMCRNFLQNFNNPAEPFKEMKRVLRDGGICLVVESAVYKEEIKYTNDFCRVTESFAPDFPSHELLHSLFDKNNFKEIEQQIVGLHRKWFQKWIKSKQTNESLVEQAYRICLSYPKDYKKKYNFKFFEKEKEIESTLTFSFVKGKK